MQLVRGVFAALIALAVLNAVRQFVFPRMFSLGVVIAVVVAEVVASMGVGVMMGRESIRLARRGSNPALGLAAPDAGPDTCRVCGLDDLSYWDDLDTSFGAVGEDQHVVGYGSGRAHRDCALVVPYGVPRVDPQREIVRMLQRDDHHRDWVARERRHDPGNYSRWAPGRLTATLRAAEEAGSEEMRIEAPADGLTPSLGDFVVAAPGTSHGEIVSVLTVWMRPFDGGLVAVLRGPLRYSYPAGARLVPVAYGWGWNERAGRPNLPHEAGYPHACECGCRGGGVSESAFLASVRAACGIPAGPGHPEPSNIASDLINAGVLSVDDAQRMAAESMPVVNGALRDSLGAYWTCQYCNTRRRADSDGAAEKALRRHSGSCAERRAGGVFSQACAAIPADNGRPAFCLAHNQGDPRCTVYETAG